jgi:hypothetical protein
MKSGVTSKNIQVQLTNSTDLYWVKSGPCSRSSFTGLELFSLHTVAGAMSQDFSGALARQILGP